VGLREGWAETPSIPRDAGLVVVSSRKWVGSLI